MSAPITSHRSGPSGISSVSINAAMHALSAARSARVKWRGFFRLRHGMMSRAARTAMTDGPRSSSTAPRTTAAMTSVMLTASRTRTERSRTVAVLPGGATASIAVTAGSRLCCSFDAGGALSRSGGSSSHDE